MGELWDVLLADGEKTGRTIWRGERLRPGEYHLVVHIWIRNEHGDYLIQKRADHLKWLPGGWATTGGAVVAGEDSLTAALRETKEEIGLTLQPDALTHLDRLTRVDSIVDVWLAQVKTSDLDGVQLGPEVSAVKWAAKDAIMAMVASGAFYNYRYFELLP